MLTVLICVALWQQHTLGSGWALAVTLGEVVGSLAILGLSLKRGVGGLTRLDKACYLILAVDMALWLTTANTLLALHLTVLADLIAFTPTLVKTWRFPNSETPLFYVLGTVASLLSVVAVGGYSYGVLLFPLYLALINLAEAGLICVPRFQPSVDTA